MTRAEAIRRLAAQEGQIYLSELHRALKADTPWEKCRVRDAVKDLVRAGTLRWRAEGLYEWCGDKRQAPARKPVGRSLLWRLMRFARQFTKEEIRYRSGATLDYVHKCVTSWRAQGLIVLAGYRKKGQTREAVYRVVSDRVQAPPLVREKA